MGGMPTVATLEEVTDLARRHSRLFVRWSGGPDADAARLGSDDLTGIRLPGLSANPLAAEPWWGERPLRSWIARRLNDYSHLKHDKGRAYSRGCWKAACECTVPTSSRSSPATARSHRGSK